MWDDIIKVMLICIIIFVLFILFIPVGRYKEIAKTERLLIIGPMLLINLNLIPLFFKSESMTNFGSNLQLINFIIIIILILFFNMFRSIKFSLILLLLSSATSLLLLVSHFV